MSLLVALTCLGGCSKENASGPETRCADVLRPNGWCHGAARGFNLLLITLDTTRADRIGCYGYDRAVTPAIDALAHTGVRFADAVVSTPVTLPSHATILTGMYPSGHGVRDNGAFQLTAEHITLAETLRSAGYATAAFIGCFVLDERFGLNQGFDVYDFQVAPSGHRESMPDFNERPADAVTDAALAWLRRRTDPPDAKPFFAWVHYFDPHLPYESPLQSRSAFAGRPYDAEIAFVDTQVARLVAFLDGNNLRDRTLIAVVSDHGEALGDHGESTHGMLLYESTVGAVFLLSCPGLSAQPQVIEDRVVGLVDLRPTLEDLLGAAPSAACDGVSAVSKGLDPHRAIYVETRVPLYVAGWSPLYAWRWHGRKFILSPQPEYYDLTRDPGEAHNLFDWVSDEHAGFRNQLAAIVENETSQTGAAARHMREQELQRLGSLGYVGMGSAGTQSSDLPDPKAMMPLLEQALRAEELHHGGSDDAALKIIQDVSREAKQFIYARRLEAAILKKLGRLEEAADALRQCAEMNPAIIVWIDLARALRDLRRFDEAEQALIAAEAIDPKNGNVPLLRGDCLAYQRRFPEAIVLYEKAIQIDPNRIGPAARQRIAQVRKWMGQP